ncbi:MAG: hypothetical protein VZS44_00985 [Bacilli bacterium]|nr:hypothetical protein [Bacilli bacterium]
MNNEPNQNNNSNELIPNFTMPETKTDNNINNTPPIDTNTNINTNLNNPIPTEINTDTNNPTPNEQNNNIPNISETTQQDMPEKKPQKNNSLLIIIIIILIVGIGGFFAYNKLFSNTKTNTSTTNSNNSENNTKTNDNTVTNSKDIYPSQKIYEVPMGIAEKGVYKKLCKIKMGENIAPYGTAYNNNGDYKNIRSSNMKEAFEEIDFNNYFATTISSTNEEIYLFFYISPLKVNGLQTWEDVKNDYMKDNINLTEIGTNNHPAFTAKYKKEDYFDTYLLYKIDNDWVLSINYKGNLTSKLSDKELGEKLYDLIIPD